MIKFQHANPEFYAEVAETADVAEFVEKVVAELMPQARYFQSFFDQSRHLGLPLSVEVLEVIQRKSFEGMALLFAGLPPRFADAVADQLAPAWAELKRLRARRKALADAAIADASRSKSDAGVNDFPQPN